MRSASNKSILPGSRPRGRVVGPTTWPRSTAVRDSVLALLKTVT